MTTPSPTARRTARTLVAVLVVLTASGCGLRLESEPPPLPVPDAVEVVRDRTASDAVTIAETAEQAIATSPDAVADLLASLAAASAAHAEALGGPYTPFPDLPPDAEPTATAPPPLGVDELVELITTSATAALADADATEDAPLARLVAVIGLSRLLHADAITAAAGDPVPPPDVAVPELVPDGVTGQQVSVLVHSEDALGLAWEVLAARFTDAERRAAADRATVHRLRAQDWALAAGIAGTGQDPRRSTYALPAELTDPDAGVVDLLAVTAVLEAELAAGYLGAAGEAAPGGRTALLELALDCLRAAAVPGSEPPTFPGTAEPPDQGQP